jgi:D-alanyl-D-alanine dipeptidase
MRDAEAKRSVATATRHSDGEAVDVVISSDASKTSPPRKGAAISAA